MLTFVAAVTVALVVSFSCSIFESVLLSINHAQVEALSQRHGRAGRLMTSFKRNIDTPIAAILIVNTIAHTIGSAVAGASYASVFDGETLWIFTIVFTTAVLLFTEIIPKTLGVSYAGRLATAVAYGIQGLVVSLRPLVSLSERISRALRGNKEVPVTSVEEIRLLTALGRNEGVVGVRTAGIIEGATQLRRIRAADVLVPRGNVVFLSALNDRARILATVRESGHSRFPFSPSEELDDVTGVVLVKELLFWMQDHPDEAIDWDSLVRDTLVVPETRPVMGLMRTFQDARKHLAVVVNEYGGVEGLVTLEDVLEEMVGEIDDESDRPSTALWEQSDGALHARAYVDLRTVSARLNLDWSPEDDVASLGGLVTELLGRLPVRGDSVEWKGFRLEVLSASERRPELIAIRPNPESASDDTRSH